MMQRVIILWIPLGFTLFLLLRMEHVQLVLGLDLQLLEHVLVVQKSSVDFIRRDVILTDYEDFGGLVTRRLGLCRVHLLEQLLQHPNEGVVVLRTEHLGDEPASLAQELRRQFQGAKREAGLLVGVVQPILSHVGCAVVEDDVGLPRLEFLRQRHPALFGGDVFGYVYAARYGFYGE